MNQLQAVALNEGLRCYKRLWRTQRPRLESSVSTMGHGDGTTCELLDLVNPTIAELSQAVEREMEKFPEAQRLATDPGGVRLTALAFVLIIGEAERFQCGKQVASYLGLVRWKTPAGMRRRLGHITKQGVRSCASCWWRQRRSTVRSLPEWRSRILSPDDARGGRSPRSPMARRLAASLYWMLRQGWDYQQ